MTDPTPITELVKEVQEAVAEYDRMADRSLYEKLRNAAAKLAEAMPSGGPSIGLNSVQGQNEPSGDTGLADGPPVGMTGVQAEAIAMALWRIAEAMEIRTPGETNHAHQITRTA